MSYINILNLQAPTENCCEKSAILKVSKDTEIRNNWRIVVIGYEFEYDVVLNNNFYLSMTSSSF